ncbi:MAG TPA: CsbD family protein [Edaphobacter sp.]|jgi:uncharacterized protein YjbJ (UPF0337 family)|nr:CsbD family protein [Edaphobacter sp.]
MNKQTVEGKFDQVAGKVKEKVGEVTGNQKLANAGAAEQIKGAAKETWGKTKDTAAEIRDDKRTEARAEGSDLKYRAEEKAHDARESVTTTAQNIKDKISDKLDDIKHNHERNTRDV